VIVLTHTAIAEATGYLEAGYRVVVDLDLAKFFDRVHHQRLLDRMRQRITDLRVLDLVRRMLKAAVVMPDGTRVAVEEGTPQGGPLSPLLSNIVLDEFDQDLARRGLRFVRYADDANVFVRSERAGIRVMASLRRFLEQRLRLQINEEKSAVRKPEQVHFLGFRFLWCVPEGRDHFVGASPTRAMVCWPGSWQAVRPGNWPCRGPVTNVAVGGGANRRAVTCVKPEQASKGKSRTPTRPENGEGSMVWGSSRQMHPSQSTGVMGTARRDRGSRKRGRPVAGEGSGLNDAVWHRSTRESDRVVVPLKPGNSGGGRTRTSGAFSKRMR